MSQRKISAFVILLLCIIRLSAQEKLLSFEHLTTQQGLSHSTITCILKDYQGYIWIGTEDGLNRYDGYEITVFKNTSDKNSISSSDIFSIFQDKGNNLWIGTRSSLELYDRRSEQFIHYNIRTENGQIYLNIISAISMDNEGTIWAGTHNYGLFRLTDKTANLEPFESFQYFNSNGELATVNAIYKDMEGTMWLAVSGYGLLKYLPEDSTFLSYINNPLNTHSISSNEIRSISGDEKGNLYLGTFGGGLNIFNTHTNTFYRYPLVSDKDKYSRLNYINSLTYYKEQLWIATDGAGLCVIDLKTNTKNIYNSDVFNNNTLTGESLTYIYLDEHDNAWIGLYLGGMDIYKSHKKKFYARHSKPKSSNRFGTDRVFSILEDNNGNILTGIEAGQISIYNPKTKKYSIVRQKNDNQITSNDGAFVTISLLEDSKKRIWAGTYLGGFSLIDLKTGVISNFMNKPGNSNSLSNDDVRTIIEDSDGKLWIATNGGGVNVFDPETRNFIRFLLDPSNPNSLSNNWVRPILEDSDKNIWIGTYWGLSKYNPAKDEFINYLHSPTSSNSLNSNIVFSLHEDSKKNIWIGTEGGLNLYNKQSDNFISFTTQDGLPNNTINGILEDNSHNLWLSTNNGLSKFNPESKKFMNYDVSDGLQGNGFINGSYYKGKNGYMYFGGMNGYTMFHPDSIKIDPNPPDIIITNLYINGIPVQTGKEYEGRIILSDELTNDPKILLRYYENFITFEFVAFQYTYAEHLKYIYMLEGLDSKWNQTDATMRRISYSNLDPGNYTLKVKAISKDGIECLQPAVVHFSITLPFWKATWFRIAAFLLIAGILYFLIYYWFRSIKLQKIRLENQVTEHTKELQLNHALLIQQSEQLNETNTRLEERQQLIIEQSEALQLQSENLKSQAEFLEKANKNLEEINKTKDKFFSIIAHDLKSPFATILGFAELLQKDKKKLDEKARIKYILALYDSAKRVYALLENLLQWSRAQTNSIKFMPRNFLLVDIVNEIILLNQENLRKKGIHLINHINPGYSTFADYEMIHVVILNLISNAIKFTPKNGTIALNAKYNGEFIQVSVSDTGIGMPDNILQSLFHIDKTISVTGTNGEKGTGLGLSLCKDFIERNGGQIWVESTVGEGSVFTFETPKTKSD
ncbi:MAG: hypothetical protein JXJ22_16580 [Bacteroidales bacterium]|nr:hypothetical protein [Bacteroidales bacterium]